MVTPAVPHRVVDVEAVLARRFPGSRRVRHHGRAHYHERISGSGLVVEFMKLVGVDVIFGVPGGASLPLTDALTQAHLDGAFRYVLTGHEQGAAFEAEGYAAATGCAGFCTATSGPGATNLITGLADAFRDSRPVMAFTGNTATTAEPEAFQAIDIVGMTHGKATKASLRPECSEEVQEVLVRAYHTAVMGRPGSVLVDLPKDVQVGPALMRPWEDLIVALDWQPPRGDEAALEAAARMLAAAERPVLYVGHGVTLAGAAGVLRALSRRFDIPVVTTVHGLGSLPSDDDLNLGMVGMHGTMVANIAPYLSDVCVALGARFDDRVVGARPDEFAPHAHIIHIDVDTYQLNRVRAVELAIHADVKHALQRLLAIMSALTPCDRTSWRRELAAIRQAMPTASYDDPATDAISHELVYAVLSEALEETGANDVITTFDVGTHQMKGAQWLPVVWPRSFITSGGMGSMGCAIPMAVGACLARPDATVLAVTGDGGFVMSSHELDTIGSYGLPVKIVLFDDAALGMVGNWHGLFFDGRNLTSDRRRGRAVLPADVPGIKDRIRGRLEQAADADDIATVLCEAAVELAQREWPLFAATAASYGIPAERVHSRAQLRAAVQRALTTPGPYLLQVVLPAQNHVYPLMEPGTTPQDIAWRETYPGSSTHVYARERFDYEARRLHDMGEKGTGPMLTESLHDVPST